MRKKYGETLTITLEGRPGSYTVAAEGPGDIIVPARPLALEPTENQHATIEALEMGRGDVDPDDILDVGRALHDAVFTRPIVEALGRARGAARTGELVRLRIQTDTPDLARLPWEAMHDGDGFLSAQSEIPLVRALPQAPVQPSQRLGVRGALRILLVAASPDGMPRLRTDHAVEDLRRLLVPSVEKGHIVLDTIVNTTLDDLRSKLLENYHILCFVGHGDSHMIYLDDGEGGHDTDGRRLPGDPYSLSARDLARELEGKPTRLVFLAACGTAGPAQDSGDPLAGFARDLARMARLPAVVAMQYPITDPQANRLTARFFEALAAFRPVDVALAEARKALILQGIAGRDVLSPILYLQSDDARLFEPSRNWPTIALSAAFLLTLAVLAMVVLVANSRGEQASLAAAARATVEIQAKREADNRAAAEGTAVAERHRAEEQAREADRALSGKVAAQANATREKFPQRSLLLAAQSLRLTQRAGLSPVAAAEDALWQSLAQIGGRGLPAHHNAISDVALSPNGRWLATGSQDTTVRLWDLSAPDSATNSKLLTGHTGRIMTLAISSDNRWLATGSDDTNARLWDLTAVNPGDDSIVLAGHKNKIVEVAFSPDGHWLATSAEDGTVRLWDVTASDPAVRPKILDGPMMWIDALAFSPDGHWLAVGSHDQSLGAYIHLWDLNKQDPAASPIVLNGTKDLAFSPDSRWLATDSAKGPAQLWDLTLSAPTVRPKVLSGYKGSADAFAFSPDGRRLAVGYNDSVALWDLTTQGVNAKPVTLPKNGDFIFELAISPDGHWLVVRGPEPTVRLWDLTTLGPASKPILLPGHEEMVAALAITPDSRRLITGSYDGTARIWDLEAGSVAVNLGGDAQQASIPIVLPSATGTAVSPDGH